MMRQFQSMAENVCQETPDAMHAEPLQAYLHEHPTLLLAFLDIAERYSLPVIAGGPERTDF